MLPRGGLLYEMRLKQSQIDYYSPLAKDMALYFDLSLLACLLESESHHSRSRSREDKPTYLGVGPDLDVERTSQGGGAYDSVGVKSRSSYLWPKQPVCKRFYEPTRTVVSVMSESGALLSAMQDFNLVSVAEDAEFEYSPVFAQFLFFEYAFLSSLYRPFVSNSRERPLAHNALSSISVL
ncbi:hypothetical protein M9H77_23661 [Catharanthus roseus]|uniref:Uncharacterized protein n=1 Tax=Catharanthus roseus TaxID=4058 RepID=A0ACC0AWS1_CATRO|nr:hypothetical protein M9H77_23661 [Catharanthus roseus]